MKGENAIDGWTLVHVGSGIALRKLRVKWETAFALMVGMEIFEWHMRKPSGGLGTGLQENESPRNIATDLAAGALGFWIANRL